MCVPVGHFATEIIERPDLYVLMIYDMQTKTRIINILAVDGCRIIEVLF